MEINNSFNPMVLATIPGGLQPARPNAPTEQPGNRGDASALAAVPAPARPAYNAERLDRFASQIEREPGNNPAALGLKARQALAAYGSLNEAGEKAYVHAVMGIDIRV